MTALIAKRDTTQDITNTERDELIGLSRADPNIYAEAGNAYRRTLALAAAVPQPATPQPALQDMSS